MQARETYTYGNGRMSYLNNQTGDSYQYLTNQSGSVTGLTKDGQAVASTSYNLYGSTKENSDETGNPFAYNGEARDVTGLDYLRARYYDSQVGTFLTEDSYSGELTDPLSQNLYTYVQNNPVNYTDPSGHLRLGMLGGGGRRKTKSTKVYPIFSSDTPVATRVAIINNQPLAKSIQKQQIHAVRTGQPGIWNPTRPAYSPYLGYVQRPYTPVSPTSRSYQQYSIYRPIQTVQTALQRAQANGQSTYNWGKSKSKEAGDIHRNWTKALEETIRHVCNPKTAKGKDGGQKKNQINKKALLTLGVIGSVNNIAFGIYDWLKKNPIGISNTNVVSSNQPNPGILFSGFVDYSSKTTTGGNSWLNIDFTNGKPSGMTFNMNSGTLSLGYGGGNWSVSGSGNFSKYNTISGSISFGKNGFEANYVNGITHKNGVSVGNGAGIRLSPDVVNGMLSIYNTFETGQSKNGVTTTNTVNSGFKTINGSQAAAILSIIALIMGNPAPMEQIQQIPLTP